MQLGAYCRVGREIQLYGVYRVYFRSPLAIDDGEEMVGSVYTSTASGVSKIFAAAMAGEPAGSPDGRQDGVAATGQYSRSRNHSAPSASRRYETGITTDRHREVVWQARVGPRSAA